MNKIVVIAVVGVLCLSCTRADREAMEHPLFLQAVSISVKSLGTPPSEDLRLAAQTNKLAMAGWFSEQRAQHAIALDQLLDDNPEADPSDRKVVRELSVNLRAQADAFSFIHTNEMADLRATDITKRVRMLDSEMNAILLTHHTPLSEYIESLKAPNKFQERTSQERRRSE